MCRKGFAGVRSVAGVAVIMFFSTGAFAGDRISGHTVYLNSAIEGFHRISVTGELDGKGTVTLDRNTCEVDEFGDPARCTLIAEAIRDVVIKEIRTREPARYGRRLYVLEGAGLKNQLMIVVTPRVRTPLRLIYADPDGKSPVAITLEPTTLEPGALETSTK